MHRNTFINSPRILTNKLNTKKRDNLFFAGQITGVEGYTESMASGLIAGINMAKYIKGEQMLEMPSECILGALLNYITDENHKQLQPVNSNWALINNIELPKKIRKDKKAKAEILANRSLEALSGVLNTL